MNAKINANGRWEIEVKPGVWRIQCCPFSYTTAENEAYCGDWCPLFGDYEHAGTQGKEQRMLLKLCHRSRLFDTLTDERKPEGQA